MLRRNLLKSLTAIIPLSYLSFELNNPKKDVKTITNYSDGRWEENFYNSKNQLVFYKNSNGYWEKFEYNKQNQISKYINSQGYLYKFTSDSSGISFFDQDSFSWCENKYFENGKKSFYKDSYGYYFKSEHSNDEFTYLMSLHQKHADWLLTSEKIDRQSIITYPKSHNYYANSLDNFLNRKHKNAKKKFT
jgi:hypothetical protein